MEENKKLIIDKYILFLKKICFEEGETYESFSNFGVFGSYGEPTYLVKEKFEDIIKVSNSIIVTESIENIEKYYNLSGTIVLRPYDGEKKLILGCGNLHNYKIYQNNDDFYDDFISKHIHMNEYTINPDISMNPSIASEYGKKIFSSIPDNSFKEIIFEGFMANNIKKYPYYLSELDRLLKNNGKVLLDIGIKRKKHLMYKLNGKLYQRDKVTPVNTIDDFREIVNRY